MGTKTRIAGLMVALVALSVPVVYADAGDVKPAVVAEPSHQDGDWHHGNGHHEQEAKMMAKVLNLSEDQQKQMKDIHQKQKDVMKSNVEQIESSRDALNEEIIKATPDMKKVGDIVAQIKTLQSQMVDNRLNSILEIKKVMTPEQFAGYMALEKVEKLMKHHEGPGKFGPKGDFCKMKDGQKHWGDKDEKLGDKPDVDKD